MSTCSLSSSSRGLISQVAAITEENSRAAQERVNIAQSACDSVGLTTSFHPPPQVADWMSTMNQIDRQIRLLDQSVEEVEAVIASASHPDAQPRRILSYAVTGRWLRPQIEPPPQLSDNHSSTHELQTAGFPIPERPRWKTSTASTRKTRKGKKRKSVHGQRMLQKPETSAAGDGVLHESDPNEPRYCYCNNVSYGAVRVVSVVRVSNAYDVFRWCNVKTPQNVHTIGWVSF